MAPPTGTVNVNGTQAEQRWLRETEAIVHTAEADDIGSPNNFETLQSSSKKLT